MGKAYADYSISDVLRLNPSWLEGKQSDLAKFNEQKDQLSRMMGFGFQYIASYPFLDVFGDADISKLDQSGINKAIHEYTENLTKMTEKYEQQDGEYNASSIQKAIEANTLLMDVDNIHDSIRNYEDNISRRKRSIQTDLNYIKRYRQNIASHMRSINDYQDQIETKRRKLELSNGKVDPDKVRILSNIPSHYMIKKVLSDRFTVVRVKPMVGHFRYDGQPKIHEYGFMEFTFKFRDLTALLLNPCGYNLRTDYVHPHIGSYICWGNLGSRVDKLMHGDRDTAKFFTMLDQLIENVDWENPFMRLGTFEDGFRLRQRMGVREDDNGVNWGPVMKPEFVEETDTEILKAMYRNGNDEFKEMVANDYPELAEVATMEESTNE